MRATRVRKCTGKIIYMALLSYPNSVSNSVPAEFSSVVRLCSLILCATCHPPLSNLMAAALCYGAAAQRLVPRILRACIGLSRKMQYPTSSCSTPYLHPTAEISPSTVSRVPPCCPFTCCRNRRLPRTSRPLTHIEQRRHTLAGLMLREYSFDSFSPFHLGPVQAIFRV